MIHELANVDASARIGDGSSVWDYASVGAAAELGAGCIVGQRAFVDGGVTVGDNCKIQNNVLLYAPARLGDGVFLGPGCIITNDRHPRAVTADGALKRGSDWQADGVSIGDGAAIGAGAIVVAGVSVGAWALVAAGAVVAADVPAHRLVAGVPARPIGWVSKDGHRLVPGPNPNEWLDEASAERYFEGRSGLELASAATD